MIAVRSMGASHLSIAVTIALCLWLAACAGLPAQILESPGPNSRTYDGFLVYAAFRDLAVRGSFERSMCDRLLATGHACETMLHAAPPTMPQNGASRQQAALASGAQAVITIELADPDSMSRRILAAGRPGYRVSVVDAASQKVVARVAIEGRQSNARPGSRAKALARAVVDTLDRHHLLTQRP